jgi:hypothetical protein
VWAGLAWYGVCEFVSSALAPSLAPEPLLYRCIAATVLLYCLQVMMDFLKEWEEKLNIKITCSQVGGLLWVQL